MYKELNQLLQKPTLYEKTQEAFWNDPHISKGMLEAHLDPNTDAASRKPDFINRSVNWICSLLPEGAKLLDIGCGPGLYTKPLSKHGLRVTGLDFSERSITYAKATDPQSDYILQSYLEMEFENAFDMITLIWCDYGALIPEDRTNLLNRIYRALNPGGLFLLDVFTPVRNSDATESKSWEVYAHGGFWSPNPHICLNAKYIYGKNIDMHRHVILEAQCVRCFNLWNTCFSAESLSAELTPHGFSCKSFFADVTGAKYYDDSQTLCVVAQK